MNSRFIIIHEDENIPEFKDLKSAKDDADENGNAEDYVIYEIVAKYTAKISEIKWTKKEFK